MLFALVHFHVLCHVIVAHPICVFLLLVNDTHIVGLASNVIPTFLQLQYEFSTLRFLVHQQMCSLVWTQKLDHFKSLPLKVFTLT